MLRCCTNPKIGATLAAIQITSGPNELLAAQYNNSSVLERKPRATERRCARYSGPTSEGPARPYRARTAQRPVLTHAALQQTLRLSVTELQRTRTRTPSLARQGDRRPAQICLSATVRTCNISAARPRWDNNWNWNLVVPTPA